MPDKVEVNEEKRIIEITSFGVVTSWDIADSVNKISEIYNKTGIHKVLVDTTNQEKMPGTVGIFKLFSTLPKEVSYVLLVKENQLTERDLVFAETVSVNRGIMVKVFYDRELALEWLKDA